MADVRASSDDRPGSTDEERRSDDRAGNDRSDEERECDEEWEDDVEWTHPLRAEHLATGEPLVIVDYYDLVSLDGAAALEKLLELKESLPEPGSDKARVLIFDHRAGEKPFDVHSLIAIATVHDATVRVEIACEAVVGRACDAVRKVLGPGARYRGRTKENPIEVFLSSP